MAYATVIDYRFLYSRTLGQLEQELGMGYRPKMGYELLNDVDFLQKSNNIKTKLSLLPRKCKVSGKSIWFKLAYRVRHTDFGWDMDEYHIDRWYSSTEYVILRLKA